MPNIYNFQTRIVTYLLGISLLLLPFITFYTLGLSGLAEPINTIVYIPICIIFFFSFKLTIKNDLSLSPSLQKLFLVTIALSLLILATSSFDLTNNLFINTIAILFFILVIQNLIWLKPNKEILIYIVFSFGIVQLIYGLIEYAYLLPFNKIYHVTGRPEASFRQVNILATMMCVNYFIALYLFEKKRGKLVNNISLVVAFFTPVILFACSSKTSFVSLICCFAILLALGKFKCIAKNRLFFIISFIGLVFTILLSFFVEPPRSAELFGNTQLRKMMYLHGVQMVLEKPLLGWGAGDFIPNFYFSLMEQINLGNNPFNTNKDLFVMHPHNEVLLWTIELGIIGFLFITYLFVFVVKKLVKNKKIKGAWGLIIATPILTHTMLEFPMHASSLVSLSFLLILYCFADFEERDTSDSSKRNLFIGKTLVWLQTLFLPLLIIIFLSAIASAKYTGSTSISAALETRPQILLNFPAKYYVAQTDIFVKVNIARADKNRKHLEEVNEELFNLIKSLPVQQFANVYLANCDILKSCETSKVKFIKKNFPFASNE